MDRKDKIIQEQKERIIALNEEIQRLHALLSGAGIEEWKQCVYRSRLECISESVAAVAECKEAFERIYRKEDK